MHPPVVDASQGFDSFAAKLRHVLHSLLAAVQFADHVSL